MLIGYRRVSKAEGSQTTDLQRDALLAGQGAAIDTATPAGKLVFGIFAALAEYERELISERTVAGLASARARARQGGRPFKMTAAKLRLAMAAMGYRETKVGDLCRELGVSRQTLYRHVSPTGELRADGVKLLARGSIVAGREVVQATSAISPGPVSLSA